MQEVLALRVMLMPGCHFLRVLMPPRRGCHRCGRTLRPATGPVVGVVAGLLLAGPVSAQTLTEAFAYAYNNNPQLLAQRALLRATDEGVPQALSNWRPTVSFTGQAEFTRGGFEEPGVNSALSSPCNGPIGTTCSTPTQFSSFTSKSLDLKVTQLVYLGGRTEAATRQAINNVQATRAQTMGAETTVFQALAHAYLDLVR